MAMRQPGRKRDRTSYEEIFFTWTVPGMSLVLIGYMTQGPVFAHVGMALLCLGVYYYGRLRSLNRFWQMAWMAMFSVYLTLAFYELLRSQ